jgi:hypothetical protein
VSAFHLGHRSRQSLSWACETGAAVSIDVRTNFLPDSFAPLARRVVAEVTAASTKDADPQAVTAQAIERCMTALRTGSYSDARVNPRTLAGIRQERAFSPNVDELGSALFAFMLGRYEPGACLKTAQRSVNKGFADKRLGFFLNQVDAVLGEQHTAVAQRPPPTPAGDPADIDSLDIRAQISRRRYAITAPRLKQPQRSRDRFAPIAAAR